MMSFGEVIKTCLFKKYFSTSGRATRSEFWWFVLFKYLVFSCIISAFAIVGLERTEEFYLKILLVSELLLFIPSFTVLIRRLHDTGHSVWALLWLLIPYVGCFVLLIMTLSSSGPRNEWGANPNATSTSECDMFNQFNTFDNSNSHSYESENIESELEEQNIYYSPSNESRLSYSSSRNTITDEELERTCADNERLEREREGYECYIEKAKDAYREYEYYKSKAKEAYSNGEIYLRSAESHECYGRDLDDDGHFREALEDRDRARRFFSDAEHFQNKAAEYYDEYEKCRSEADTHRWRM